MIRHKSASYSLQNLSSFLCCLDNITYILRLECHCVTLSGRGTAKSQLWSKSPHSSRGQTPRMAGQAMHEQHSRLNRLAQGMLLEDRSSETPYTGLAPVRPVRRWHMHEGSMCCHLFVAENAFDILHFHILANDQGMIDRQIRLSSYKTIPTNGSASK